MRKNIITIAVGIILAAVGGMAQTAQGSQPEGSMMPSPIEVIRPEIEILERQLIIEVQLHPSLDVDTSMRIVCATSAYRGEVHVERQDLRVSLSISGEIRELSPEKILVSYDAELRLEDSAGGRGLAGSGGATVEPGKSVTILTIGGRSVILTVRFPPEETE